MDCFVTIDAESLCLPEGVPVLSAIRDEVAQKFGNEIPIVWFVRFQRRWKYEVNASTPEDFTRPLTEELDGYELAKKQFISLQERGDEIAWHYHANNFTHRADLDTEVRLENLRTDLRTCASEIARRHPQFTICSFRFGWFYCWTTGSTQRSAR